MGADRDHEERADDDADAGSRKCVDDRAAGSECVRTQNGEGAEYDPESVLEPGALGDVHRDREPDSCADAVLEPDGPDARVLECKVLRGCQGAAWRCRLNEVELLELGRVAPGGDERVRGDLPGRVGHRADAERRVERVRHCTGGNVGRQVGEASHECSRNCVSRALEPSEVGLSMATVKAVSSRAKGGRRSRERLGVLGARELELLLLERRREE